jgi:hypothetical protein
MKSFLLTIMALMLAVPAFSADFKTAIPFANMSASGAAVKTSAAYFVGGYARKSVQVTGVTLTSNLASPTFKNMSGTLIAQCGPTSSGPWVTCLQGQSSAGAAVSLTTNTVTFWEGASSYIRFQWTSGTIGGKLKAWFNWM